MPTTMPSLEPPWLILLIWEQPYEVGGKEGGGGDVVEG